MPFTVTKLKTVHTGVLNYQAKKYHWITSSENSKSNCLDDQEFFNDKDCWSTKIEVISLDGDDKLKKTNSPGSNFSLSEFWWFLYTNTETSILWCLVTWRNMINFSQLWFYRINLSNKSLLLVTNWWFLQKYWKKTEKVIKCILLTVLATLFHHRELLLQPYRDWNFSHKWILSANNQHKII